MPFRESSPVEVGIALMKEYESGAFSVRYGISRDTFCVWKRRRDAGDKRWFETLSRAPGHCPHAVSADTIATIIAIRTRFPRFGPKKIKARLALEMRRRLAGGLDHWRHPEARRPDRAEGSPVPADRPVRVRRRL